MVGCDLLQSCCQTNVVQTRSAQRQIRLWTKLVSKCKTFGEVWEVYLTPQVLRQKFPNEPTKSKYFRRASDDKSNYFRRASDDKETRRPSDERKPFHRRASTDSNRSHYRRDRRKPQSHAIDEYQSVEEDEYTEEDEEEEPTEHDENTEGDQPQVNAAYPHYAPNRTNRPIDRTSYNTRNSYYNRQPTNPLLPHTRRQRRYSTSSTSDDPPPRRRNPINPPHNRTFPPSRDSPIDSRSHSTSALAPTHVPSRSTSNDNHRPSPPVSITPYNHNHPPTFRNPPIRRKSPRQTPPNGRSPSRQPTRNNLFGPDEADEEDDLDDEDNDYDYEDNEDADDDMDKPIHRRRHPTRSSSSYHSSHSSHGCRKRRSHAPTVRSAVNKRR
eukprot:GHVO01068422.1.p1 GENE.GHVO01068422.1~~GHVO01068422.1.p1  ORF type:complete len:382 (+),score=13.55 GHVO01068422.1:227-1372(+)